MALSPPGARMQPRQAFRVEGAPGPGHAMRAPASLPWHTAWPSLHGFLDADGGAACLAAQAACRAAALDADGRALLAHVDLRRAARASSVLSVRLPRGARDATEATRHFAALRAVSWRGEVRPEDEDPRGWAPGASFRCDVSGGLWRCRRSLGGAEREPERGRGPERSSLRSFVPSWALRASGLFFTRALVSLANPSGECPSRDPHR